MELGTQTVKSDLLFRTQDSKMQENKLIHNIKELIHIADAEQGIYKDKLSYVLCTIYKI